MKKSLTKTIFYTLFYWSLSYIAAWLAFELSDFYDSFQPENSFEKVNQILIWGLWMLSMFSSVFFFVVGYLVVMAGGDLNKIKGRG